MHAWPSKHWKTRYIRPLLDQFWFSVADAGRTLIQQWVSESFIVGKDCTATTVDLMLGQRSRRWPNIKPTQSSLLATDSDEYETWAKDQMHGPLNSNIYIIQTENIKPVCWLKSHQYLLNIAQTLEGVHSAISVETR